MPPPEPTGVDVEALRRLLAEAGLTRLQADYIGPNSEGFPEGWRLHDFPVEPAHIAYHLCDGLEEAEAKLIVALVNAALALIASAERASRLEAALRELTRSSAVFQLELEDQRAEFEPDVFMRWDDAINAASGLLAESSPEPINETTPETPK